VIRLRKNPISSAAPKAEFTGIAGLQYLPCSRFKAAKRKTAVLGFSKKIKPSAHNL